MFLTARDDRDDLRTGFTRGGDDYLTKPFSLEELELPRSRRSCAARTAQGRDDDGERLRCADLERRRRRPPRAGGPATRSSCRPTEFRLLRYLLANQGRVLSKAQILDHVWQYDFDGDGSIVETYISYLRTKVDHVEPRLIQHRPRASATPSASPSGVA